MTLAVEVAALLPPGWELRIRRSSGARGVWLVSVMRPHNRGRWPGDVDWDAAIAHSGPDLAGPLGRVLDALRPEGKAVESA